VIDAEPRAAFIGDLVFNRTHAYIADGRISAWLVNLDRARTLLADVPTIYPGHGGQGTLKLLNAQKEYLLAYRAALSKLSNGMPTLSDDAKQQLTTRMQNFLPEAPLSFLIAHSADAVAFEIALDK
jgi:glyoxylase-like metal-dependent hydrolase (beta-lactamase superfamily II)